MSEKTIPGLCAVHAIITDNCREMRGDAGAIEAVLCRVRERLESSLNGWKQGKGAEFHIAFTVKRPEHDDENNAFSV